MILFISDVVFVVLRYKITTQLQHPKGVLELMLTL